LRVFDRRDNYSPKEIFVGIEWNNNGITALSETGTLVVHNVSLNKSFIRLSKVVGSDKEYKEAHVL
jgi:hypothetical protein